MSPDPHPLLLDPVIVPKPWGGRRLETYGKPLPDEGSYGESWDIADLPDEIVGSSPRSRSTVIRGPLTGATLHEVIAIWGRALLGSAPATDAGDFPLLFKFLDARENLSVQVHPDESYVAGHPGTWLKTESWYIVDAAPGAVIYLDLQPGVTVAEVAAAAGSADIVELLRPVPAVPGAFHHLPAGLIHAIGAGVLVAEPQTPSDTTFRLYDWVVEYGRLPRPLHIDAALASLLIDPPGALSLDPATAPESRMLITTPHYWMREHRGVSLDGRLGSMRELRILSVLDGNGSLRHGHDDIELSRGTTVVVPAAIVPDVTVTAGGMTMLELGLGPPVT